MHRGYDMSKNSVAMFFFILMHLGLSFFMALVSLQGLPYVALGILAIQFVSVFTFSIVQGD